MWSGMTIYTILNPAYHTSYTVKFVNFANTRTDNVSISGSLMLTINSMPFYLISGVNILPNTAFVYNYPIVINGDPGNSILQAYGTVSGLDTVLCYQSYIQSGVL